jgi:hypothetical protein
LVLWRPDTKAAALLSMGDALECALCIPGAVGAVLGRLSDRAPFFGQTPDMPSGFALAAARSTLAYARRSAEDGDEPEEIMITGATYCGLQQVARLPDGHHAFAQVTLLRPQANPALAHMELRRILHHMPRLLGPNGLPRRARRAQGLAANPSDFVPVTLLERVLDRLRVL